MGHQNIGLLDQIVYVGDEPPDINIDVTAQKVLALLTQLPRVRIQTSSAALTADVIKDRTCLVFKY